MASKLVNPASSHMLVSEKEKRETKEKMKRNAATTTKFVPENVATNHFEKRKTIRKGKKAKKRARRKKTRKAKNLVDPASSHMLVSQKEKNGKQKKK